MSKCILERRSIISNDFYTIIEGEKMNQNQDLLRDRLNSVIASGLAAKAISKRTGITTDVMSRFKNGHVCLCECDKNRLEDYLNKVALPE